MASEEAINAKFEAFESRMEEKIRSLFTEFSIGRPSSRGNHNKEKLHINEMVLKIVVTSSLIQTIYTLRLASLDGKKETRLNGSRARSTIFYSIKSLTLHGWRLLPSTSMETLFSGSIGLSTPMEVSLSSDSRTTKLLRTNRFRQHRRTIGEDSINLNNIRIPNKV
ncbi:hypothetical protein B296_00013097 [Ensete ventricosum]|uniref:Uncharacterized protein n=1 Tax=Ensete ventricosum TaxID=4639 RepID=A0A427AVP7_ENSVE|nr:hypothetical protein B296_00013097 [Ensete ventricosum]